MAARYTSRLGTTLRVSSDTKQRLQRMADRNEVKPSFLMRLAFTEVLKSKNPNFDFERENDRLSEILPDLRVTEAMKTQLEKMADKYDLEIAFLLRWAVIDYLDKHEQETFF